MFSMRKAKLKRAVATTLAPFSKYIRDVEEFSPQVKPRSRQAMRHQTAFIRVQ
jgi:hypothetical protein